MKVSAQEEYGFRCMTQIALHERENIPTTAPKIAKAEGISLPYANKLLTILKRAGLILSVRGVNGGYQLSRDASQIPLSEILKALGGFLFSPDFCQCFPGLKEQCVHNRSSCSLRSVWSVLGEYIEGVLSETTLEDLVGKKEPFMANMMRLKFGEQALRNAGARQRTGF